MRDMFRLSPFKLNMRRLLARNRSCELPRTMANHQSQLLLNPEHLKTALSYLPDRQGRLIILQPIVPQPSHTRDRAIPRSRIVRRQRNRITPRRTIDRNRIGRLRRSPTIDPSRIGRLQLSQTTAQSLTGVSLLHGSKLLRAIALSSARPRRKRSLLRRPNASNRSRKRRRRRSGSRSSKSLRVTRKFVRRSVEGEHATTKSTLGCTLFEDENCEEPNGCDSGRGSRSRSHCLLQGRKWPNE